MMANGIDRSYVEPRPALIRRPPRAAEVIDRLDPHMPDRVALVTGASSGIGLAIAGMLGEEGHGLTVAARRPDKLADAAAGLRDAGFEVEEVAGNMADEDDIQRVVAAHRERWGRLDVLVNNAGVGVGAAVGESTRRRSTCSSTSTCARSILFYRECADLLRAAGAETAMRRSSTRLDLR